MPAPSAPVAEFCRISEFVEPAMLIRSPSFDDVLFWTRTSSRLPRPAASSSVIAAAVLLTKTFELIFALFRPWSE